jgi:CDP-6-deoxy-D-xylo-4-hexulose-3-dehydrase
MSTEPTRLERIDLRWPLMEDNIVREDLDAVIEFLKGDNLVLTQSRNVREFEREWSEWLGRKYSVFVNSGASANLVTISALRELRGLGEIIVPTLTWVSDIACVLQAGFKPVFVDIDRRTLGMDTEDVLRKVTPRTKAVFITHILGYNALTDRLLAELAGLAIPLIEDACESHGATFHGGKLGTFGWVSNFSFYYAHHLSTIEGGIVCTDDEELHDVVRMFRSHGMVREADSGERRRRYAENHPDLNPDFIFAFPGYNVRSTEINAIIGRSQLKRLDANNERRRANLSLFLKNLDPEFYQTDFVVAGSCNYACTLVLNQQDRGFRDRVMETLRECGVEFRRGTSGGGNQLRQPYLKKDPGERDYAQYPNVEHVHFYGFYIGNYPGLDQGKILRFCSILNAVAKTYYRR